MGAAQSDENERGGNDFGGKVAMNGGTGPRSFP